jgi:two-component system phosphate regulon sensor histidine kinase PhoR
VARANRVGGKLSLRARLFLSQALVVTAALALVVALAAHEQRAWVVERQQEILERTARLAALQFTTQPTVRSRDWPAVAGSLGRTLQVRVTLIDRQGRVLGDSDVPRERLAAVENHAGRPEVRAALAGHTGHALRRSKTIGAELVYTAIPAGGSTEVAVLRLAEPLTLVSSLNASLLRLSLAAAGVALLLSVPLLLWSTERQASRIRALEAVARRLAGGESGVQAREHPSDELGRLGAAMNAMAEEARTRYEALQRERDERESILAHMHDGVAVVDDAGRVVRMNRGLSELLDIQPRATNGTALSDFVRLPEIEDLVATARNRGLTTEGDLVLWPPGSRHLHATATPLGGTASGSVLLVVHDLTEFERLARVRQDFVANVSHELRTPLTSLRGYAETLLDGGLEDAANREQFVRVIRDQAIRLEALTHDLLTLAELERPGATPRLVPIDLREVVETQVTAFRDRAVRAGLKLECEPGPPLPARADRARIDQVVANLLDNAIKYTESGEVRVTLGAEDSRVWCEVRDTGPGIPAEHQPRVFERFYRVDRARSREKGGTGLGLSIVKHIVVLHGGDVALRSQPGEGSTFRFEIPNANG